ncbi:MAG: alpha/beta hydrolase family protein [Vicinamibacterales bacterium]
MTARAVAWLAALAVALPLPAGAAETVQLRAADGTSVAATLYPASRRPAPAIVLVHMLTRSRDDWRGFAERLQAAGAACLAIDLRGHGGSSGSAAPSAAMALDVRAAVAWLAARSDIDAGAIGIVGASFGATAALLAAGDSPVVKAVALVSPAGDYRGVRLDGGLRKYGSRPLLLVASTEDPYALRTVRALTEDEPPGRQLRLSALAAHGSHLLDRDPDAATAVVDWLRQTLLF